MWKSRYSPFKEYFKTGLTNQGHLEKFLRDIFNDFSPLNFEWHSDVRNPEVLLVLQAQTSRIRTFNPQI